MTIDQRIAAIEARQRAAGMHDPGCDADSIVGHVTERPLFTDMIPFSVSYHHEDSGKTGSANREMDNGNLEQLARQRLIDKLRDTEWFKPCTCWLSQENDA